MKKEDIKLSPLKALKEAINICGGSKLELCASASIARTTLDRAIRYSKTRSRFMDVCHVETAEKLEQATGLSWRLFCPATHKKLFKKLQKEWK